MITALFAKFSNISIRLSLICVMKATATPGLQVGYCT